MSQNYFHEKKRRFEISEGCVRALYLNNESKKKKKRKKLKRIKEKQFSLKRKGRKVRERSSEKIKNKWNPIMKKRRRYTSRRRFRKRRTLFRRRLSHSKPSTPGYRITGFGHSCSPEEFYRREEELRIRIFGTRHEKETLKKKHIASVANKDSEDRSSETKKLMSQRKVIKIISNRSNEPRKPTPKRERITEKKVEVVPNVPFEIEVMVRSGRIPPSARRYAKTYAKIAKKLKNYDQLPEDDPIRKSVEKFVRKTAGIFDQAVSLYFLMTFIPYLYGYAILRSFSGSSRAANNLLNSIHREVHGPGPRKTEDDDEFGYFSYFWNTYVAKVVSGLLVLPNVVYGTSKFVYHVGISESSKVGVHLGLKIVGETFPFRIVKLFSENLTGDSLAQQRLRESEIAMNALLAELGEELDRN